MRLADVLIHINEILDDAGQIELQEQLRGVEGIVAPRFSLKKDNLLFVSYNADAVTSTSLIRKVRENGLHAQLVGL